MHSPAYTTHQKANSCFMQTTNPLNPTVHYVSEADRGVFPLWLGDLTSTSSNGCEKQGWLLCMQKHNLYLQYKYLKVILNNLFITRKTSSHPCCQNFNPYQKEITICVRSMAGTWVSLIQLLWKRYHMRYMIN